ncbi:hypothetical protein XBI1_2740049 [Xenorhabdus bovienii str. Intermedium]|uniref:Uncharacterized protein n=1 Tax=Xenorhabdus bovienii str. Intermedium TaxID=1379677 RepID=A0A077QMZ7_XENBV|nr:hypothetical protein XBI1_2740049 [Xenorhabdus bovienii str. Intermedium]
MREITSAPAEYQGKASEVLQKAAERGLMLPLHR